MAITDRAICTEEGSFTFNGIAGDTFGAGDTLELHSDGKVWKGDGDDKFVGVADYGAVEDDECIFYGPGNKVWGNQGTTGVAVGDYVKVDTDGGFTTWVYDAANDPGRIVGICLELESSTYCKVLLY